MGARGGSQITERDRAVLSLLAEHRVMVVPQVALSLGVCDRTATERLHRLEAQRLAGYRAIFTDQPAATWITRRGLNAIESRLPPPSIDLKGYRHDIGVGWIWLQAQRGAFGPAVDVTSEREMRSHDLRADRSSEPFGIALGGIDSYGRMTRHYPDLMVTRPDGTRVAVELELTSKSRSRLDRIMRGYAGDGRIDRAAYLVPTASLQRLITDAVARAGIGDLVHVRRTASASMPGVPDPEARSSSAVASRSRSVATRPGEAGRPER